MKIEHYEFGKMIIDGKEYMKDLIIHNDKVSIINLKKVPSFNNWFFKTM